MKRVNEILYGEPKGGKVKYWSVYVEGDTVFVEHGRVGGKLQLRPTVCTPKNVGKANETTPEQQALLEAKAKWTKQHDNKLYRLTPEEATKVGQLLPMLAIDGTKKPEKIDKECWVQPKLDGVRCMVYLEEGEVKAISRSGKFYELHEKLKNELHDLLFEGNFDKLDGELYIHGVSLQKIVSYVRNTDKPEHNDIEFHLFDIPSDKEWEDRYIHGVLKADSLIPNNSMNYVVPVKAFFLDEHSNLDDMLQHYIDKGYEGLMVRNIKGKYEYNHRSNDLIKVKKMNDNEAQVIGCREDKNGEGVLSCKWYNGNEWVTFDVKMKGTHGERLVERQVEIIGKWVNFKYQALTDAGKPQFPVGQYVRECDENGEPLI